ncbi:lipoprotein [Vibrio sp. SM6]|uniref:Lipoprotein n=2 Tax=Vibrio agarilyticus TaxID=2726741 RepID=A0A7X8TRQ7_9VIBR|nr:lipoprotein [Vibrio agarilyticus]NLS13655.1 lipoprotein [Vibrio agarilyticus]
MKFSFIHLIYPIAFPECGAIIGGIGLIITMCKMKKLSTSLRASALLVVTGLFLVGCGQSGALYLPQDETQVAPVAEPAASTAVDSAAQ